MIEPELILGGRWIIGDAFGPDKRGFLCARGAVGMFAVDFTGGMLMCEDMAEV